MTRNLKALGLAFVAVFAMSAIVASAAQAVVKVTTAESPAILTTSSIGKQKFVINPGTAEPAVLECSTISSTSTVTTGATSITASDVTYGGCAATIGANTLPATIDMEGCDYFFHGGEPSGSEFINGQVDIAGCTGTGPVITIFSDAEHKTRICKYTVWAASNLSSITIANTAGSPDDVDLKAINVGVDVTRNEGILCPKVKEKEKATYNGEVTIKAFKDSAGTEGSQIGVTAS